MPTPDSIYGALVPDSDSGAGPLPSDALLDAMQRIAMIKRPMGDPGYPMRELESERKRREAKVSSLGQTYQNYPAATFDQRFGPYNTGPIPDPELLRQMLQPAPVIPGAKVRV